MARTKVCKVDIEFFIDENGTIYHISDIDRNTDYGEHNLHNLKVIKKVLSKMSQAGEFLLGEEIKKQAEHEANRLENELKKRCRQNDENAEQNWRRTNELLNN